MTEPRGPYPHDVPDDEYADSDPEAGVDAILRDDALLDALGRGELPASYRADVTARLLTGWRDDLDEGLPPSSRTTPETLLASHTGSDADTLSASDAPSAPTPQSVPDLPTSLLLARVDTETSEDDTEVLALFGDDTTPLAVLTDPDRIDESARSAFVAAGYARRAAHDPAEQPVEESTEEFAASFDRLPPESDEPSVTELADRRSRRRRLDRVVVAVAAAAAIVAAGSAGSVAAASTAHPGDTLWPISRVIYAERARSIVASEEAHASLDKARDAMQRGDTATARRYLADAQEKLDEEVREGSDEADKLAQELQITAAMPELQSPFGDPSASPDATASNGATGGPSTRSRWGRGGDPRRGTGNPQASPSSAATPTTAPGPIDPAPTSQAPDPDPTQQPEPTPSGPGNTPDPAPSGTISNGGSTDGQSGDQVTGTDAGPTSE